MYRIIMSMILSNYYTFIGQSHCVFVVLYIFMDEKVLHSMTFIVLLRCV